MSADTPLFSVITITYNAEAVLAPTMHSVASQQYDDYEHIIVDGASKDGTLPLVEHLSTPHTRVHSEPDRGIYDAMNKGLGLARGQYVIFMNAGDRFASPDTLSLYARAIADNETPGIVYGQTRLVDAEGHDLGPRHLTAPDELTLQSFRRGMLVCHQAMAVLHRIAPLYNLQWRYSADYEWCIRCLQHSRRNVYTGAVTALYLREGTTTQNRWRSLRERFQIMCRYYGTLPTVLRHVGFVPRFIISKIRKQ